MMSSHKRLWTGFLFVVLAVASGCDGQDSTQPAAGSISVGARKDNCGPERSPGKGEGVASRQVRSARHPTPLDPLPISRFPRPVAENDRRAGPASQGRRPIAVVREKIPANLP